MASALAYLHANKCVHGDIKAANALIAENGQIVLCDFGLLKTVGAHTSDNLKGTASLRWQSPEQHLSVTKTKASDVYSFGITIAEVSKRFANSSARSLTKLPFRY